MEDEHLIRRAKEGDQAAWSELYESCYPDIFRYLYARTGLREEAEDLASQVFVIALRRIDSFQNRGRPFLAWLYGIARKIFAESQRRSRRRGSMETAMKASASDSTAGPDVEAMDLRNELASLNETQREVVILRLIVGLPAKRVGELLNKKENAIYAIQFRALKTMRRTLSIDSDPPGFDPGPGEAHHV